MTTTSVADQYDTDAIRRGLETDGIIALKGAFPVEWVDRLREDLEVAFEEARGREGGAVSRGPQRWYVEIHPEALRGFADLVDHPWVRTVCETVLGPDYQIVEVGCDTPFPGAQVQPWHRDFRSPHETREEGRLTSLAFNLTTVDVFEDMGPFEIALGTQFEAGLDWHHQMFPPKTEYPRFESLAVRKYPQRGDISVRSALTIHRGTKNQSQLARPVLVFGLEAPGGEVLVEHSPRVTQAFYDSLPQVVTVDPAWPSREVGGLLRPLPRRYG